MRFFFLEVLHEDILFIYSVMLNFIHHKDGEKNYDMNYYRRVYDRRQILFENSTDTAVTS